MAAQTERRPQVRLQPNRQKIAEAILFLIEEAERASTIITQYEIVKSIFVSDIFHLKKFGRPVSFDNYVAMEFGPVPSETYDMLKPAYAGARYFGADWPLWQREKAPERGSRTYKYMQAARPANRRKLSESDMIELAEARKIVGTLGFRGVVDWTHKHKSYASAWVADGTKGAYDMDYHLLIENEDEDLVSDLAHASKYI